MVIFGGDLYDDQVFKTDEVSQIFKKYSNVNMENLLYLVNEMKNLL